MALQTNANKENNKHVTLNQRNDKTKASVLGMYNLRPHIQSPNFLNLTEGARGWNSSNIVNPILIF
jgi:hypothetical protein